jgi:hypothetical protein
MIESIPPITALFFMYSPEENYLLILSVLSKGLSYGYS